MEHSPVRRIVTTRRLFTIFCPKSSKLFIVSTSFSKFSFTLTSGTITNGFCLNSSCEYKSPIKFRRISDTNSVTSGTFKSSSVSSIQYKFSFFINSITIVRTGSVSFHVTPFPDRESYSNTASWFVHTKTYDSKKNQNLFITQKSLY